MQQYFIQEHAVVHNNVSLDEEQSHHILHVLRMKEHDHIRIVDGNHDVYLAEIVSDGKHAKALILESLPDLTKSNVHITLAQGLIKKEKWDFLLQKSAEVGVDRILPFISSRTVVKTKDEKADKKRLRYEKILLEACEQCKRSTLVEFADTISFKALAQQHADLKLIAYEDADIKSDQLYQVLKHHQEIASVLVVIGSEGGFSKEEVLFLEAQGFLRVSLGPRILRAETAAITTVSNLRFFYDN